MNKHSVCPGCRSMVLPGVLMFGPVLGVTLVEACPSCRIVASDGEAAELASLHSGLTAVADGDRWYLDFLAKDQVEPTIRQDLEDRRKRVLGGWF